MDATMVAEAGVFLVDGGLEHYLPERESIDSLRRTYCS